MAGLSNGDGILERVQSSGEDKGLLEGQDSFSEDGDIRDAVVHNLLLEVPLLSLLLLVPLQELLAVLGLHQVGFEPKSSQIKHFF